MIPTRFLLGCAALALALTVAGCSGAAPAPAVEPELSLAAARVTEGDAGTVNAVFRVSLSVEGSATVTVSYATADGTAAAGADYRATSGTLTIRAGQTSGRITVPVLGDLLAEQDEHFTVTLRDPRNATIARAAATGTIVDDDDPAQPGTTFRDCAACPELVLVPAGSYRMGSPATETGRHADEQQRSVTIAAPFAVGVHEVTFAEWDACVAGGGCGGHRPDDSGWGRGRRPVVNVSWDDAQAYVAWLSAETGADYRLLTEAEWEYAARAGTTTPFHTGATIATDQANYDGLSPPYGSAASTGRRPPQGDRSRRTPSACTTCTATWRSWCRTATRKCQATAALAAAAAACCAGAPGPAAPSCCARPTVAGARPTSATTSTASA